MGWTSTTVRPRPGEDPAPRLAALIVAKLCRTVFAEYDTRLDGGGGRSDPGQSGRR